MIFKRFFWDKSNSKFDETKNNILIILDLLKKNSKDFTCFNFMQPVWYTLLKVHSFKHGLDLDTFKFTNNVRFFLSNLNFFDDKCKINAKNVVRLSTITQDWDVEIISNKFFDVLEWYIEHHPSLLTWVKHIIWEWLNNVYDHSWSEQWLLNNYSSWQYFTNWWFLQICISDWWVWILSTIRKKYQEIQSTKEAVKKALEAKVSWWKFLNKEYRNLIQYSNRGIWLTTTLEILKRLKWDLFICTKDILYTFNWETWKEKFIDISDRLWTWTFLVINVYSNDNDVNIEEIEKMLLWDKNDEKGVVNIDFL